MQQLVTFVHWKFVYFSGVLLNYDRGICASFMFSIARDELKPDCHGAELRAGQIELNRLMFWVFQTLPATEQCNSYE